MNIKQGGNRQSNIQSIKVIAQGHPGDGYYSPGNTNIGEHSAQLHMGTRINYLPDTNKKLPTGNKNNIERDTRKQHQPTNNDKKDVTAGGRLADYFADVFLDKNTTVNPNMEPVQGNGPVRGLDRNDNLSYNAVFNQREKSGKTNNLDNPKNMNAPIIPQEYNNAPNQPNQPNDILNADQYNPLETIKNLKQKKQQARKSLKKTRGVLNDLLQNKRQLQNTQNILGLPESSANILDQEINGKQKEITNLEEQIKQINQQLEALRQQTEITKVGTRVINLNDNKFVESGYDNADKKITVQIQENDTLIQVIEKALKLINREEQQPTALDVFRDFKNRYLESVQQTTGERASSIWKQELKKLQPGDTVVLSLSEQGVVLDIPTISGGYDTKQHSKQMADDYHGNDLMKAA